MSLCKIRLNQQINKIMSQRENTIKLKVRSLPWGVTARGLIQIAQTTTKKNEKWHAENKRMVQWVRHVLLHFLKGRHLFFIVLDFFFFVFFRLLLRLLECLRNPFYFIDWKKQPLFGTSRVFFFFLQIFFLFFFLTTRTRDNKTEAQQQSALKIACPSVFLPNHTNNG